MPRVDNPNSIKESLPGQLGQVRAVTADIKGASRNSPFSIVVGMGGAIVNGVAQLLGGILGPLVVIGSIAGTTTVSAGTDVNAGGNVNATGNVTGATLQISGSVKMPSVYSTPITTAYRVVYNGNGDGSMGYNLSSRRFKQNIETHSIDPTLIQQIRIVTFRYKAAVEELGDAATTEVGLIAEEIHDLGLTWLVDYDNEGVPEGIKFDRLALAALALAQDLDARLTKIEERLGL